MWRVLSGGSNGQSLNAGAGLNHTTKSRKNGEPGIQEEERAKQAVCVQASSHSDELWREPVTEQASPAGISGHLRTDCEGKQFYKTVQSQSLPPGRKEKEFTFYAQPLTGQSL